VEKRENVAIRKAEKSGGDPEKAWTYGEAKTVGVKSFRKLHPRSLCSEKCLQFSALKYRGVAVILLTLLIPDTWYHFVAIFDHGIIKLYINSKLDDQKIAMFNRTSFQSGKPLYLGTSQIQKAYLHGRLDEVRIYNYTLSSKAISNRFNRIF
jgi:acyl-coenzyme A synthetase/AMP-(fatty) acid ligase